MIKINTKIGLSLTETIIYVAVFSMAFILFVSIFLSFNRSNIKIKTKAVLDRSAMTSVDRITREIRNSLDVNTNNSVFDVTPGVLVLSQLDSSGNPTELSFSLVDSNIEINRDGGSQGMLLPSGVAAVSLVFRVLDSGRSKIVRVEIVLQAGDSLSPVTSNYYGSAILRGSY